MNLNKYWESKIAIWFSAAIFTNGYIGITGATSLLFGDASANRKKRGLNAKSRNEYDDVADEIYRLGGLKLKHL